MEIQKIREQFSVFLLSERSSILTVAEELKDQEDKSNFRFSVFSMELAHLEVIRSERPDVIFVDITSLNGDFSFYLNQVIDHSPDSQLVLIVKDSDDLDGISVKPYDYLLKNYVNVLRITEVADRACEKKYLEIKLMESKEENERLLERLLENGKRPGVSADFFIPKEFSVEEVSYIDKFFSEMKQIRKENELIKFYLQEVSSQFNDKPVLYFRYIENKKTLLLSQSVSIDHNLVKNIGCRLNQVNKLEPLSNLIEGGFGLKNFEKMILQVQGKTKGVAVVLDATELPGKKALFSFMTNLCGMSIELIKKGIQLHKNQDRSLVTGLLNETRLDEFLNKEVSRSRRIEKPVSLMSLSIDRFADYRIRLGEGKSNQLLSYVAGILKKTSRLIDVLFDLGNGDFAVLLPHTEQKGAALKSEKMRRIAEKASFAQLKGFSNGNITLSVGVSEYPKNCTDAEGLLKTADDALFFAKKYQNGNKVCLYAEGRLQQRSEKRPEKRTAENDKVSFDLR